MDYQKILEEIQAELKLFEDNGLVANYIPALAKIDPNKFGMHICTIDGQNFGIGDHLEKFSIQSISKSLTLAMAFEFEGNALWKRVGVEPSGNAFNSLLQLEYENGIPRNPLINAGALVIADVLNTRLKNPKEDFIKFVRKIAGEPKIEFNLEVAESERKVGYRNTALANLMKAYGNIENDIEQILDFYFHQCSIEMSCMELSKTFLFFANHGMAPDSKEKIISMSKAKRINAIMQTCGLYDEAGEFTFKVGLPGKSGVGGGIVAIHPEKYAVAVWSPRLNKKGNSNKGMKALELLTTKSELSIF
jgi:glutaminase